jgi:hypothetical protein
MDFIKSNFNDISKAPVQQLQPQHPREEPMMQHQPEPQPQQQRKDWDSYEGSRTQSIMKSEFDQKVYLVDIDKRIDFKNIITLVTKELDTSFINDQDLKVFYQILFENVLEWANMGLEDLAKIRLSKLFAELKLEKSVGGFERILQGATLSGSVVAPLPSKRGLFPVEFLRRQEQGPRTIAERMGEQGGGG